jgi:hypothetical protein
MIDTKAIRAAADFSDKRCGRLELDTSTILALLDRLEAAEKDAARMNWLEQNLFNRENIDPFTKKPCTKFNMWVMFSPKGVQGSARGIIDAAISHLVAGRNWSKHV